MRTVVRTGTVVFFLILTLCAHPALAATIHVPADHGTIQGAIDAARVGDLVLVSPGTYFENIDYFGKDITVKGVAGADAAVIDGGRAAMVVRFGDLETEMAVLDGFTIRNGLSRFGGGISIENASPTIRNCEIIGNEAERAGGIYCYESFATIRNCKIRDNYASISAGGIFCRYSSPTITTCTIAYNIAAGANGGGIQLVDTGSTTITNCAIVGNHAGFQGGGINVSNSYPAITNCTFTANSAEHGGGIYCREASTPRLTNCILWGDSAPDGQEIQVLSRASIIVTHSDVQAGWEGEGNIDADPLFAGEGDYHLAPGSPCIDAGIMALGYDVDIDLDGDVRPYGAGIDLGADEFPSAFTLRQTASHEGGSLDLDVLIGMLEPSTWSTFMIDPFPAVQVIPLWDLPLPAIDPPIALPITLGSPALGWIGIVTGLHNEAGAQIIDIDWVDTWS